MFHDKIPFFNLGMKVDVIIGVWTQLVGLKCVESVRSYTDNDINHEKDFLY